MRHFEDFRNSGERWYSMNDEGITLKGWPAMGMFLMLAVTPVLTALVMSLPIEWLVNHVFAAAAIHAIFWGRAPRLLEGRRLVRDLVCNSSQDQDSRAPKVRGPRIG